MNKIRVVLILMLFFQAFSAIGAGYDVIKPEVVGLSSERLRRMDNLIDQYINEKKIAGSVVLMARHGKIAYFKASGLADVGKPMQEDETRDGRRGDAAL